MFSQVDNWAVSPRGAGWLFGPKVLQPPPQPFMDFPLTISQSETQHILVAIGDERLHRNQQLEADLPCTPACP